MMKRGRIYNDHDNDGESDIFDFMRRIQHEADA
jgi:hypothetical protein